MNSAESSGNSGKSLTKIIVFENSEFGKVRTAVIDGEPFFVGKDVASILGYAKPLNAIAAHVDEGDSLKQGLTDSMGRIQETILINESGLYSLILSSKLPAAKKFKRWVTSEVLKALKEYQIKNAVPNATKNKETAIKKNKSVPKMDIRSVAEIIGYDEEYLRKKCSELGFTKNGVKTMLSESQVTALKNSLVPRTSDMKIRGEENKTDLEISMPNQKWYTIEDLASLCGFASGNALLANAKTNELLSRFNNSKDVCMGGYHNTRKFYSENVLKTLKEYQVRNAAPNATKDKENVMKVSEVAKAIGVSSDSVKNCIRRILPGKMQNGKTTFLNEQEISCISKELKNNSAVLSHQTYEVSSQVKNTVTDLEILANASKAFSDLQDLYKRKEAEYKAIIAEQKPKALVYDRICNAEGLKTVEQVASNLGWGKNNFFGLMRGLGIFFYSSKDADGRKTNLPKREYVERGYFVTKEEPYTRGDKDRLYTKIYVTGKGEAWLARKLNETTSGAADRWIEKEEE